MGSGRVGECCTSWLTLLVRPSLSCQLQHLIEIELSDLHGDRLFLQTRHIQGHHGACLSADGVAVAHRPSKLRVVSTLLTMNAGA